MDESVEKYTWKIRGDHKFKENVTPFAMPRLMQAIEFIPLSLRYLRFHRNCVKRQVKPHMDYLNPTPMKQIYAAPMGGIGTGSIGRSYTGDFCRFQLVPGMYEFGLAESNMFTVCIRKKSSTVYQQALVTRRSTLKGLRSWNMAYSPAHCTYHALYPESWLVYDLPGQQVRLTCHQLSPIIPHNYKDTSLPCALLNWTIENENSQDIEISLMFTWQAGSSSESYSVTNVSSAPFEAYVSEHDMNTKSSGQTIGGVVLKQKLKNMPLDYCISVLNNNSNGNVVNVTYDCEFDPYDEKSGTRLWTDLIEDGQLDNHLSSSSSSLSSSSNNSNQSNRRFAVAVCAKIKLKANSKENIQFALVWNMPVVSFTNNAVKYNKFYTRFFPHENNENVSKDIAYYAHVHGSDWQKSIKEWQSPILNDDKLPLWYKRVLFNELYFISDGGTVWFDIRDHEHESCRNAHVYVHENGRFAYLEGHEYRMYNTYDVHFYSSFALLKLWPRLQLSLQYDFADTIRQENSTKIQYLMTGKYDYQKHKNSIPHDIGDPENEPWLKLNAYNAHDTRDWRDLNLKFILSIYRDYHYLKDEKYLMHMWSFIKPLMTTVDSQDTDKDGLVDSLGEPDQTYDAWSVTGASAYCGGLHVAALQCVCKMAEILNDHSMQEKYKEKFELAKSAYNAKLWNGKYYKYDCSNSKYNDSIMADMCCGHWFLRSSGFKYEAFEKEKIESCLQTIFEYNVMKFANGKRGAVNGMRPNGQVDITSMQSEEIWIGVNDALASLFIYEGMGKEAWTTLEELYNLCYNQLGLAFQMPEALFKSNVFRSLGYMRPLCIWSIQYALDELNR